MKKVLSVLLAAVMLFTMVPASVFAAEATSVKLVSFMRGDVSDLRSSELLEVQVEGYEGNPRELTYKWTSSLGTYLYIYNSHNMYGINNTYGEYEIYNTDKKVNRNSNVEEDRAGNKTLTKETEKKGSNTYNYFIKGVKAGDNSTNGDAQLEINIKKTSCKFHYNTSGTAEPIVYVFKKPTTTTTTTTLIINKDSVDERCEYFIDGNKGEKQPDGTVVFTGLTPNTDYTVEVRAEYQDGDETKYVYSYVDDTTKPVYSAKIGSIII